MRTLAITAAGLALSGAAVAAEPADLDRFAWMAGAWISEKDGVVTRETWIAPLGGTMSGVTQTNRPGRPVQVEFATLTAEPAGVTFTARMDGQPPTAFVLRPEAGEAAVFENPAHDFPQRVIYRPCGADMCARIEGTVKGQPRTMDWRYRRTP